MAELKNLKARADDLREFAVRCLVSCGALESHARVQADLLITADQRGVNSHGLNRLDMYSTELLSGDMSKGLEPVVESEAPGTALVNGMGGLGGYVGDFCMRLAIKKARECGIGMVVAHASNHYGIAAYYTLMATAEGMIGISMTNTRRLACPTRAAPPPVIGTNPIACSAPSSRGDPFCLDMATTTVPIGKVELYKRKGLEIPVGWGVDSNGAATTDPVKVLESGGLAPLGGPEESCGYKGYGLGLMVDVLCGVLSGGKAGPQLGAWRKAEDQGPSDLSHCFIAIDPARFAPGFGDRMATLSESMRALPREKPDMPVLVAGDPEWEKSKKMAEWVVYNPKVVDALRILASNRHIKFPEFIEA